MPGPEPLALGPGARTAWSVALVLIFGLQIGLGLRSRLHVDDRYGFAMFHEFTRYRIDYPWQLADGAIRVFTFPVPLPKRSSAVRGGRHHVEVFGAGTTRIQAQGFVRWLYENKRPEGVVAAQVVYAWERNKDGEHHRELLIWPPVGARP